MSRYLIAAAGAAMALAYAGPAQAQSAVSTPGSFNSEIGCPGDWQPDCAQAQLSLEGDGNWHGTYVLPVGSYEYKIAYDNTWDVNYGAGGVLNGPNIALDVVDAGGTVSFIYDPTSHMVDVLFGQPLGVSLPGSFDSELGCAADWDPSCSLADMTLAGDGLWYAAFALPAGYYEYKVALNGNWDVNYGAGGVANGGNIGLALADASTVYFRYDPTSHSVVSQLTAFVTGVPEPSTWAMMLLGFGAIGFAMRRKPRRLARS